jgi:hypothetical protein
MLCNSGKGNPYLLLKGKWFRNYGFSPGDQVKIVHLDKGAMMITIEKTAAQMDEYRESLRLATLKAQHRFSQNPA